MSEAKKVKFHHIYDCYVCDYKNINSLQKPSFPYPTKDKLPGARICKECFEFLCQERYGLNKDQIQYVKRANDPKFFELMESAYKAAHNKAIQSVITKLETGVR